MRLQLHSSFSSLSAWDTAKVPHADQCHWLAIIGHRHTRSAPVPLSACTVALRFSAMTALRSPNASFALSSLNLELPVMPRYSCA